MAENHPVAFRWPMKAKIEHGAKIIHVDPRFTRTSSVADIYAPVRAGSDIAFLGGMINYVLKSERWNQEPFFKTFVANYTNAATIINEDFKDTEELNGVFSGLLQAKGGINEWPFNGFVNQYDGASWQYAGTKAGEQGRAASTAQSGEAMVSSGADGTKKPPTAKSAPAPEAAKAPAGPPFDSLVAALVKPPPAKRRDARASALRFSDRQTPLRALYAGDGGKDYRLPPRNISQSSRDPAGEFRRGTDFFIRLCRGLDAAHLWSSNNRRLRAAAATARQYRPARRGGHGAARPRFDPGFDGRADPVSFDPGLHGGADGAQEARYPAGLFGG